MPVGFYMDMHVPLALTQQLRRRDVDVLTAQEDGFHRRTDAEILDRAKILNRVIFTQDVRFRALAISWQQLRRVFAGLFFANQLGATIGELARDLELVAKASEPEEWINVVEWLPFR